ncbi:peptide chain release factor 1 [Spirochaetota bacterium]|nr:peptide chain release factor 1 [Spirochaetota bacterium]
MEALETILKQYHALKKKLEQPELLKDQLGYKKTLKEYQKLEPVAKAYLLQKDALAKVTECQTLFNSETDPEMKQLLQAEIDSETQHAQKYEEDAKLELLKSSQQNFDSLIVEIRSGTGGEEASLFAADLYRMYIKLAERNNWTVEVLNTSLSGLKGLKEIIFAIKGKEAYATLKHETGTHRVQRIPETESSGRIHTSAVTVAVLGEVPAEEVDIKPADLKIDTYRASGAGGQHVNTTDSAIRITHLPTQLVVTCQDERSQMKNKEKAMKMLRARIYKAQQEKQRSARAHERRLQVGSGDRSEKIRTYNFPQGRVSDHRTQVTSYNLQNFLNGDMHEIIASLKEQEKTNALKALK